MKINKQATSYYLLSTIKRIRLRTWVSLGFVVILIPVAIASIYGVLGALGGSSATPIAHWAFDEGVDNTCSGGTNDNCNSTGNASLDLAHGAPTTSPSWASEDMCVSGKCLEFDGSDDVTSRTGTTFGITDQVTIMAWFKTNTLTYPGGHRMIFTAGDAATYLSLSTISTNAPFVSMRIDGTQRTLSSGFNHKVNTWHHFAVTYNGTNIRTYVDGNLTNTSANFSGNVSFDGTVRVGTYAVAGYAFDGFIDETKVFSSALTADQIRAEYAGGAAILGEKNNDFLSKGLLGYWDLDEASGDASDKSGNALTLTNNNSTTYVGGKFGNGGEFVPASTQYLSTATAINGAQTASFWVNPDSNTNNYVHLTASAYITSSAGTLSATGFTNPTIYVNGVQTTSIAADSWQLVTVTTDTAINANAFEVGRANSSYFDGTLDEVRLYNRALSPSEVTALYNWAPGPVGYWNFDEGSGTTAYDRSGNGLNSSAFSGDPAWVEGRFGKALHFDGNDSVQVNDADTLDINNAITLSAWVKPDSFEATGYEGIIWKQNTSDVNQSSAYGMTAYWNAQYTTFIATTTDANGYVTQSTTDMTTGEWQHIAATYDSVSGETKFYLNGVLTNTSTAVTGEILSSAQHLYFGRKVTNYWVGAIDEVKIYNYARTPQQIVEDMNAGHPTGGSPVGSQVSYWNFDEMYGIDVYDSVGGYDGEIDGASWSTDGKFNSALDFDGIDDFVSVPNQSALNFSESDSFTSCLWFWLETGEAADGAYILDNRQNNYNEGYFMYVTATTGVLTFGIEDTATATTTTGDAASTVQDNSWYHACGVRNVATDQISLYLNGKLVDSDTDTTSATLAHNEALTLGRGGAGVTTGEVLNGKIDEVKIYSSALTADQIKIDYNGGVSSNFGGGEDEKDDIAGGAGDPPVGYWNFDEKTGTAANDKSGNGLTGTLTGGPIWEQGRYGSGIRFDGDNDFVDVGAGPGTTRSVSFWAKPSTTTEYILDMNGAAYVWVNSGTLTATGFTSPTIYVDGAASSTVAAGVWQHITITTATPINASDLDIGRVEGSGNFDGSMDDVKIFDYALTPAQIAYEYNRGAPIGWWKMDENVLSADGQTIYDSSGNANSGTASDGANDTGMDCSVAGKRNTACNFDGEDDYIDISDNGIFDFQPAQQFTVSAWINKTATSTKGIVTNRNSSTAAGWELITTDSSYGFILGSSGTSKYYVSTASGTVVTGSWQHVLATYDGSGSTDGMTVYINGKPQALSVSDNDSGSPITYSHTLRIGTNYNLASNFDGLIDDVRIYNYALSPAQIWKVMNDGSSVRF